MGDYRALIAEATVRDARPGAIEPVPQVGYLSAGGGAGYTVAAGGTTMDLFSFAVGLATAFTWWLFGRGLWWLFRLEGRVDGLEREARRTRDGPPSAPATERPH